MKYRVETNIDIEDMPIIEFDPTDGGSVLIHVDNSRLDGVVRIKALPDDPPPPPPSDPDSGLLSAADIEQIKARLEAATPGPWLNLDQTIVPLLPEGLVGICKTEAANEHSAENAVFIAAAPVDVFRLLTHVKAQDRRWLDLSTQLSSERARAEELAHELEAARQEAGLFIPLYGYDWKLQTFEDDEGQMGIRCDVTFPGTPGRGLGLALTATEAIRLALADLDLKFRTQQAD